MKSILIFLFTFSFLTSCSKKESEMPLLGDNISAQNMIGNWKLKSFSNKAAIPYEVTLEIKEEDGKFVLNGRSSVNFYFAIMNILVAFTAAYYCVLICIFAAIFSFNNSMYI